jgi:hypothetical protein
MLRVWGGGIYESRRLLRPVRRAGPAGVPGLCSPAGCIPGHMALPRACRGSRQAVRACATTRASCCGRATTKTMRLRSRTTCYDGPSSDIPTPAGVSEPVRFDGARSTRRRWPSTGAASIRRGCTGRAAPTADRAPTPTTASTATSPHLGGLALAAARLPRLSRAGGRFVSEFGMQGVPSLPTLTRGLGFVPDAVTQERARRPQQRPGRPDAAPALPRAQPAASRGSLRPTSMPLS